MRPLLSSRLLHAILNIADRCALPVFVAGMLLLAPAIVGYPYDFPSDREGANTFVAKAQIRNFAYAVRYYTVVFGYFPQSLEDLVSAPDGRSLMNTNRIPLDPWDHPYEYNVDASGACEIVSLGADGKIGGEGWNEDIRSSELRGDP